MEEGWRGSKQEPVVTLLGERGSGKSGFVGALRIEGWKTAGDRWVMDLQSVDQTVAAFAESASLALRLREVKETSVRRPDRAVSIPLHRVGDGHRTNAMRLAVVDPLGREPRDTGQLVDAGPSPAAADVFRDASESEGVIWLFDAPQPGKSGQAERERLLRRFVALVEASAAGQLTIPVAICLTKIDRYPQARMQEMLAAPDAALREHLGADLFDQLPRVFPNLRCFALTASGTVRNVARPVGLTEVLDWFSAEWRRKARRTSAEMARVRRSERFARVRGMLPRWLTVGAVVLALGAGAGAVWGATRALTGRRVWSTSSGAAEPGTRPARERQTAPRQQRTRQPAAPTPPVTDTSDARVSDAATAFQQGDVRRTLTLLNDLRLPDTHPRRALADSLLTVAALRGAQEVLGGGSVPGDSRVPLLPLVLSGTTAAIQHEPPASFNLAPLYLARASVCIGSTQSCSELQVREDLAWVLVLGTPQQQDEARRLRAVWLGENARAEP